MHHDSHLVLSWIMPPLCLRERGGTKKKKKLASDLIPIGVTSNSQKPVGNTWRRHSISFFFSIFRFGKGALRMAYSIRKRGSTGRYGLLIIALTIAVLVFAGLRWEEKEEGEGGPAPATGLQRKKKAAVSYKFPAESVAVITVAVFPGDVVGVDAKDRYHRIRAARDTWANHTKMRLSAKFEARLGTLFVRDYRKPLRDEGLSADTFVEVPQNSTKTALETLLAVCEVFLNSISQDERVIQQEGEKVQHYLLLMHDHTFLVPENLGCLISKLRQDSADFPYFIGSKLTVRKGEDRSAFVSLPAGNLLSEASVRLFVSQSRSDKCRPPADWYRGAPSHLLAECLFDAGVRINTGVDAAESSLIEQLAVGFSVYGPVREMNRAFDEWYVQYKLAATPVAVPCCARAPVTYHYTDHREVRYLHRVLYDTSGWFRQGERPSAIGIDRAVHVAEQWPKRAEPYALFPEKREKDPAVRFLANDASVGECEE